MGMSICECWCRQRPEEAVRCPAVGVTGSCGPPDMLGIKLSSSVKVVYAFQCGAISPGTLACQGEQISHCNN